MGLATFDILTEMEIDLDVQLSKIQLSLPDRLVVKGEVLNLILLDGYREVGRAISR